jgi:NADPH:quinone reductase-like Zn-dependent oxidoreductase
MPLPQSQAQLLLHGAHLPYEIHRCRQVPRLQHAGDLLIEIQAVGLNPIDWKSAQVLHDLQLSIGR